MFVRPKAMVLVVSVFVAIFLASCGTHSNSNTTPPPGNGGGGGGASTPPTMVALIVLENQDYASVVDSAMMPYLNSLIANGGLATNYFANTHPSIGNYFMLTAGKLSTTNDAFVGIISDDNIARQLNAAHKTWKVYAQSLPSVGYVGGDQGPYLRRHNPISYFSDVQSDPAQAANIVSISQLAADLSANTLPDVILIVPDAYGTGHTCQPNVTCNNDQKLKQADTFLSNTVPSLLGNSKFSQNGLLLVTYDEAGTDNVNGGGKVATVFVGSDVKPGYKSTAMYQHQSLLRTVMDTVSATPPGQASGAATMTEFLK